MGLLPYASNATLLAHDADGSRWVYKPVEGERPLWDFSTGTLAAREILTYEVSQATGLGVVPLTVTADGPFGPGSAQRFLDEDFEFDPRPLFHRRLDARLWPFAVLDLVTNNADRKIGHILREVGSGHLWAIDNGLTFHPDDKLRTVLWGFSGRRLPDPMIAAVAGLATALDAGLTDRVTVLLGAEEAAALEDRVASLCAYPVHPTPPEDRPAVPWPMW